MIEKTCDYCNKPFQVPNYKKDKARFCSRTCGGRSNKGKHPSEETRKRLSDAQKKPFKTGRLKNVQLICEYCKKPFKTYNYYKDKKRFCSNKCRINAIKAGMIHRQYSEDGLRRISQARRGQKAWNRGKNTRVQIICEICKRPFEVDNYRKDKARFCSLVCFGESKKKHVNIHSKISKNHIRVVAWNKGISPSKETRAKISNSLIGIKRVKKSNNITCEICGRLFEVPDCRKDKARFCSNKCRGIWISKNNFGDKIYNYKEKIEKKCFECGKIFYVHLHREKEARFCSKKCSNLWHACQARSNRTAKICKGCKKEFLQGRKSKTYCSVECRKSKIKVKCVICGGTFEVPRYLRNREICSNECVKLFNKGKHSSLRTEFKKGKILSEEHQKKCIKALHQSPNRLEMKINKLLDKYFPNEWKYVGSGDVIINGLCPDFIHTNKKLIIEVFGDVFHDENKAFFKISETAKEEYRIKKFAEAGYNTLILWESDIKNQRDIEIVDKIKNRENNGNPICNKVYI